jgi:CBS domain containing-hemolysin-like protein
LRLGVEKGKWSALLLADVMRDSSGLLLSLLVGTNLAHYLATSLITGVFLAVVTSERAAELYTMAVAAPLLFVFSDLIPKNVFLQRADTLTFFVAPLLYVSHKILTWCGAVPLLRLMARSFARLIGSPISPKAAIASGQIHQVRAILRDTEEEGLLSDVQTEMVDRIANIPGVRLSMVMVPLDRVHAVEIHSGRATLLNELAKRASTRLPVWQNTPTEMVGFINLYDVLGSGEEFTSLEKFLLPIRSLDADTSIADAINIMRREQLKLVLATRRRGQRDVPLGIVTMKDLVEELLGELVEW